MFCEDKVATTAACVKIKKQKLNFSKLKWMIFFF